MHKIKLDSLDRMFSLIVRKRADGKCEYCGQVKKLQCAHFIGRRYRNTRWEFDNCVALCFSCHNWMHDFPSDCDEFFTQRLGSKRVEELQIQARTYNKVDKEAVKKKLKDILTGMS